MSQTKTGTLPAQKSESPQNRNGLLYKGAFVASAALVMIAAPIALNSSSIADPIWLLGLKSVSGIFFISGASWALDGVHKAYGDKEAFRFMTRTLLLVAVFAAGFFLGRGSV